MKKLLFTFFTITLATGMAMAQNMGKCGTDFLIQQERQANPEVFEAAKRAFYEELVAHQKANPNSKTLGKSNPKIIIPVVFHIIQDNGTGNLSDAQINQMMVSINKYYSADANLVAGVRDVFKSVIANCNIEFRLARKDPNGNCTNGIVRVQSPQTHKATNTIKELSRWDTKKYLNVWTASKVYSNAREVGGFATLPFGFGSLATTDGIVLVANQSLSGNTFAHEAGHYLGLFHPFEGSSEDSCGNGDEIGDTPPTWFLYAGGVVNSGRGNQCGDTAFNTCATDTPDLPDMQENIMDYFDGPCSGTMFTLQQYDRMHFCVDNYRTQLISQENLVATGVLDPITACAPVPDYGIRVGSFYTYGKQVCVGTSITFNDLSYNGTATAWEWNFGDGATPATSTDKNPTGISYSTPGNKTITLKVTNANGSNSKTFTNAIIVRNATPLTHIYYQPDVPNSADGWEFIDDKDARWIVTDKVSIGGYKSIMLKGNSYPAFGKFYSIMSPSFDLSATTTPYLNFKYAFARNIINGDSTRDELNIEYSTNCGLSWSNLIPSIKEVALSTTKSLSPSIEFTPSINSTTNGHWKLKEVTSNSIPKQANVRFRFMIESALGNNFYLDDITIGQRTGLENLTAEEIGLNIVPNPFSTTTKLNYMLIKNQQVEVSVYDVVGKKVATLFNGTQTEGSQQIIFDRVQHNLSNGLYFVKFTIDGSTLTQKVLAN